MILSDRGYIPSKVSEDISISSHGFLSKLNDYLTPIKTTQLIIFTKQFRTMLHAGVPIVSLLQVLENQTENRKLRNVIGQMVRDVKEGLSLYEVFRKHSGVFSPLYCSMVRAGESSGALPEVLDRLTYILEHEHKIKSDIKSALQYPIIVLVFLGIAFFVLLTFVIPKFATIFTRAGIALPLPTKICMLMYQFLANYWYVLIACVVGGIIALFQYFKTERGKFIRDSILLRLPVVGPLFLKAAMSRFSSIFAILQASGVGVLESMGILSGTIGNKAIANQFEMLRERLEEGLGISGPLKSARYFTPMVINMVAIGEESGNLDEMLREVATHYDEEVEYAMRALSDAIGPILVVGLAAVVGFFALSIFLPMWDLTKMAH
jgi:type IV pilus assembly protein PilC